MNPENAAVPEAQTDHNGTENAFHVVVPLGFTAMRLWLRLVKSRHTSGMERRDKAQRRGDEVTEWMFEDDPNVAVVTTRSIVLDGAWIANVSHDADDGSWQFHDSAPGDPVEEDAMVVSLQSMVLRDGTLNELADLPEGWRAWRDEPTALWLRGRVG